MFYTNICIQIYSGIKQLYFLIKNILYICQYNNKIIIENY